MGLLRGLLFGALGWAIGGPIGALLGAVLGSASGGKSYIGDTGHNGHGGGGNGYAGTSYRYYSQDEQRNSFMISLLVLSAAVMKADGKVLRSELSYVKDFIRSNFGEGAVEQALRILKELLQKNINVPEVCAQIKLYMTPSSRLQLFHYLAGIADADGNVAPQEKSLLLQIARNLGLNMADAESILTMFAPKNDPYKVLEIESTATDEEVRKAYKKMAMKFHPDKVESLGEDVRKAAEEKFKNIQEAYERIKKERGL